MIKIAHGVAISAIEKLRHTPPSIASIVQRIGLMKLIDCTHAGITNVGTIAPPIIDSGIRIAQPAPDAVGCGAGDIRGAAGEERPVRASARALIADSERFA